MAPRPPNYRQQRGDRDRAKQQKKRERLERRGADAQRRREEREALLGPEPADDARPDSSPSETAPQDPSENA
jgi:hypothetical protein